MLLCEYVEIYNDKIYDLLGNIEKLDSPLGINEDMYRKEFYIKNVTQKKISSIEEIIQFL